MDLILPIFIGVFASLSASIIFLLFLKGMKPNIDISPKIAKSKILKDNNIMYHIKIINRSSRPLVDVQAELILQAPRSCPGGIVIANVTTIPLVRTEAFEIGGYNLDDKEAKYAHRFGTLEDLDSLWVDEEQSYLKFRIKAKDSFSHFGVVLHKDFHTKRNSIIEGDFEFGDSFYIK